MKSVTYMIKVSGSKLLSSLSCPIMTVGIVGLIQKQSNTLLWWGLVTIGCAIIIFDSSRYKKTEHI
jgi:hypothetical protein